MMTSTPVSINTPNVLANIRSFLDEIFERCIIMVLYHQNTHSKDVMLSDSTKSLKLNEVVS